MEIHAVKLDPECYLARNCTLLGDISIGKHTSIYPGVVMRAEREPIVIGENTNIQDNCVVHVEYDFPCTIGNNVTVGHNATIHGATVKDNTIIGMNSVILDGAVVGKSCIVGAGAVVTKGAVIPDGSMVMGIPAKVRGELSEEDRAYTQVSADDYQQEASELAETGFFYSGKNVPHDLPTICLQEPQDRSERSEQPSHPEQYNYQCWR